jgi:hypothetical protein
LIGFLIKSNEGQTLCSLPPTFLLSFPRKDGEPKNAGIWARDKQNKNEMPLGVGGMEIYPLLTTDAE